jgi:hypothetical protein
MIVVAIRYRQSALANVCKALPYKLFGFPAMRRAS